MADKNTFHETLAAGWFLEFRQPPGVAKNKAERWEVTDLAGRCHGVGDDKETAIDAAWSKFERVAEHKRKIGKWD